MLDQYSLVLISYGQSKFKLLLFDINLAIEFLGTLHKFDKIGFYYIWKHFHMMQFHCPEHCDNKISAIKVWRWRLDQVTSCVMTGIQFGRRTAQRGWAGCTNGYVILLHENFLYLFCHDFRKINDRIKIFAKCTSGVVPHGGRSFCRRGARR
jgi:hypothetical protein